MKFVKRTQYVIVNDDDSKIDEKTEKSVLALMKVFQDNSVNGSWSPVGEKAAFRMAMAVMDNYTIASKNWRKKGGKKYETIN